MFLIKREPVALLRDSVLLILLLLMLSACDSSGGVLGPTLGGMFAASNTMTVISNPMTGDAIDFYEFLRHRNR